MGIVVKDRFSGEMEFEFIIDEKELVCETSRETENIKCKNPLGFGRRPLTDGENKRRGWVWVATEM